MFSALDWPSAFSVESSFDIPECVMLDLLIVEEEEEEKEDEDEKKEEKMVSKE